MKIFTVKPFCSSYDAYVTLCKVFDVSYFPERESVDKILLTRIMKEHHDRTERKFLSIQRFRELVFEKAIIIVPKKYEKEFEQKFNQES
jgi:hypothetical protein